MSTFDVPANWKKINFPEYFLSRKEKIIFISVLEMMVNRWLMWSVAAASSFPDEIGNLLIEREGRKENNQIFLVEALRM
jgi:hypothetical protein